MSFIDLRSDTVTKPTPAMRAAMHTAEVGDDVYIEDPTVNRLQERAAEIFGREAALFVPSGTMGNQIAVKLHTKPGNEVVIEERGHIFNYELSAMAVISGTIPRPVRTQDGLMTWDLLEPALRTPGPYYRAQTGLISIENTHNMAGGAILPQSEMENVCERAHQLNLPVHLDGARIFNAAAALRKSVAELTRLFDSIMFCLSKGLGAPVGSMLLGNKAFIEEARVLRKMLGGGMRQVGVLAAAGLIALEETPARLPEDHANAKLMAEELASLPGIKLDPESVQTNILIFDISGTGLSTPAFTERLKESGVLAMGINPREMRFVTHYDVSRADCEQTVRVVKSFLNS